MKKLVRDGKVGVLYSSEHGAGWSTGAERLDKKEREWILMDSELVSLVLEGKKESAVEIVKQSFPDLFWSGRDLKVGWVDQGLQFEIDAIDGQESIIIIGPDDLFVA